MCGIAGIFDMAEPGPIDRAMLEKMNDALVHRGPDGEGIHVEPGVGLAHRRLAIIDLDAGHQPMFNEDGTVAVTFNGEIYNFQELVQELARRGHRFQTHCDTEVIVHAWEEWGADCVTHFRGMFAFAVHDRNQGVLFLARDRLGKKPLYYTFLGDRFCIFASELKALLATSKVSKRIQLASVDTYLAFGYVPDPDTIYEGIFKLPPGHHLYLERGQPPTAPSEYWRCSFHDTAVSEASATATLLDLLNESIKIRLMSDVPLGAFLSGGVDSSGIVAMMARQMDSPVKTFSIGFGKPGEDELPFAESVARRYHTKHTAERASTDFLAAYLEQAAIFDEPFADSSSVPTYQVSQLARRHVVVALSGDAGDELFAGYRRYRLHHHAESVRRVIPGFIRAALFGSLGRIYPKLDSAPRWLRAKTTFQELALDMAEGYYRTVCKVHDDVRTRLYSSVTRRSLDPRGPAAMIAARMREADTGDPIALAQYADLKTYLPGDILTKVDRASMAASLEVRVPMLDHKFVEWAASLPTELKLRQGEGKYVLKRALEPYVPYENLYRAKRGFATSLAQQFRGAGTDRMRKLIAGPAMGDIGLFDMETITNLIDEHGSGRIDHSHALWSLLMFAGFLERTHFPS